MKSGALKNSSKKSIPKCPRLPQIAQKPWLYKSNIDFHVAFCVALPYLCGRGYQRECTFASSRYTQIRNLSKNGLYYFSVYPVVPPLKWLQKSSLTVQHAAFRLRKITPHATKKKHRPSAVKPCRNLESMWDHCNMAPDGWLLNCNMVLHFLQAASLWGAFPRQKFLRGGPYSVRAGVADLGLSLRWDQNLKTPFFFSFSS